MKNRIVILLLLFAFNSFGQNRVQCQLVDLYSDQGIPYVNVGVIGKGLGTVSDKSGSFTLNIPASMNQDSILISMIGYKRQIYLVSEFRKIIASDPVLRMEIENTHLDEVVITNRRLKSKVLGNTTQAKNIVAGFVSNELGSEIGVPISIKRSPTFIDNFSASIVSNKYGVIKFRLNIYKLVDGFPGKSLLYENIIIETEIEQGVLFVDLSPYNIVVEDDFVIALEWIENLGIDGLFFSATFFGDPILARQTSQDIWMKKSAAGIGFSVGVRY